MKTVDALGRMNRVEVVDTLSAREIEVMELVAIGLSNKEIAVAMCVSDKTVKQHIVNIYEKLSLTNSAGNLRVLLTLFAIRHGFVVPQ
jgi:DNA-binding NarL/FixJ family response regulator